MTASRRWRTIVSVLVVLSMCTTGVTAMVPVGPTDRTSVDLPAVPVTFPEVLGDDPRPGPAPLDVRTTVHQTTDIDATGLNGQRKVLRGPGSVLYAVLSHNGEIHYANSADDGITWTSTVVLSGSSAESKFPSIEVDGSNIFVIWEDGTNISFRRSTDDGATWDPPLAQDPIIIASDINKPRVPVVGADGANVVVAWADFNSVQGHYEIARRRSTDTGATFGAKVYLSPNTEMSFNPSMSASGSNIYLVYQEGNPGGPLKRDVLFTASTDSGATWSPVANISNDGGDSRNPSVVGNGTKVYLTWVDVTGGNNEIVFKTSVDGGSNWDNTMKISDTAGQSLGPGISVAGDDIYVVWYDNDDHPHNDTYIRRYNSTSASWEPKFKWSDLDLGYTHPSVVPLSAENRVEFLYVYGRQPVYSVRYGFHNTLPNTPPELTWTGETNYEAAGLYPETGGTTAHTYTFRVKYVDADNNEPLGNVLVLVDYNQDGFLDYNDDNERYTMSPLFQDDDYTDGRVYGRSIKYPGIGTDYKYRFYARDSRNNLATGFAMETRDYPDINWVDYAPRLFWTNEKGYSSDGVEPESGTSSTEFVWHVSYYDQDNNMPAEGYPKVLIDLDNNTFFSPSEYFNMTELDEDDTAYDDGKFYTYTRTLPNVGSYSYRFVANDIWGIQNPATDKPSARKTGPYVTAINTPPRLTFPNDTGFEDDGLDPNTGSTSRLFVFRAIYTDDENNPPASGYPRVWIDFDVDTIPDPDERFTMWEENVSDDDRTDGKIYKYETFYPDVATYTYKFEARDTYDLQATGDPVALKTGPVITKFNDAPTLAYPDKEGYGIDGVHPDAGRTTTLFEFMVEYTDKNNDPPDAGYPKVFVDADLNKMFTNEEIFVMAEVDPSDANFDDGKLYSYGLTLTQNGRYSYMFDAWDGFDGHATGPPTKLVGGPNVGTTNNNPPVLSFMGTTGFTEDGVDPDSGPSTQLFMYKVIYRDPDNDKPEEGYPKLYLDVTGNGNYNDSNERQEMYEEDTMDQTFSDGKIYYYETDLTTTFTIAGLIYTYMFLAKDVMGSSGVGITETKFFGPNITSGNSPPQLVWPGDTNYEGDGLHPEEGNATTEFVFRVTYMDEDNDPPSTGFPKIFTDITDLGRAMEKEDAGDNDYTDGVTYVYRTTLSLGTHNYRFYVKDKYDTPASSLDPPAKFKEGPIVEENNPPILEWPLGDEYPNGVSPTRGTVGKRFIFKVVYIDADGDKPAQGYPKLLLDRNGDGDFEDAIEKISLNKEAGTDFTMGVTYSIELILEQGKHSFMFEARDSKGNVATGEATTLQEGAVKVSAASTTGGGGDMTLTLILIVLIIVAAIVGVVIGRKMGGGGGGKAAKEAEVTGATPSPHPQGPEAQAQAEAEAAYYHQQGYGYTYDHAQGYGYAPPPEGSGEGPQTEATPPQAPSPPPPQPEKPPVPPPKPRPEAPEKAPPPPQPPQTQPPKPPAEK